jgi:hypothetical protein
MERICVIFFKKLVNFVSSCVRYVYDKSLYAQDTFLNLLILYGMCWFRAVR